MASLSMRATVAPRGSNPHALSRSARGKTRESLEPTVQTPSILMPKLDLLAKRQTQDAHPIQPWDSPPQVNEINLLFAHTALANAWIDPLDSSSITCIFASNSLAMKFRISMPTSESSG